MGTREYLSATGKPAVRETMWSVWARSGTCAGWGSITSGCDCSSSSGCCVRWSQKATVWIASDSDFRNTKQDRQLQSSYALLRRNLKLVIIFRNLWQNTLVSCLCCFNKQWTKVTNAGLHSRLRSSSNVISWVLFSYWKCYVCLGSTNQFLFQELNAHHQVLGIPSPSTKCFGFCSTICFAV